MKRLILTLVILCCIVPGAAAAAPANNTTANATATASSPTAPTIPGDPALHVRDYWMQNGSMHVTLHADTYRAVTLTAPTGESGEGMHAGDVRTATLDPGETAVVTIPANGKVWLSTSTSTANGKYAELVVDTGGSIFPSGPFDGGDMVVFGGSVGLTFALVGVYRAVEAREGADDGGERVA